MGANHLIMHQLLESEYLGCALCFDLT